MDHPETYKVTKENGPRPAGKPDRCFYCGQLIGEDHKPDCVLRERTIVLRATIEYVERIPQDWTEEDIYRHFNESRWCANNLLDHLDTKHSCLCDSTEVEFVREATEEDEQDWG